jgi:hypothetical protein
MTGNAFHKSLAALAFALAAAAPVASHAVDVRPLLKLGYDSGGDTLVSATLTSSSGGTTTESIKANEGFYIGAGASILFSTEIEAEVSLSYKFESITATNGDIDFTRMPLDALVFYRFPQQFRVGGGLTYHLNPKLSGSGVAGGLNVGFDDALGLVLQAEYLLPPRSPKTPKMTIGARFTMLDYKASGGGTAKSNGVGITFSIGFPL